MVFSAVYAIVIGAGMVGQWSVSYLSGKIPELETEPYRIWFHIAGELITAIMLVLSGISLLAGASWAPILFFISAGMLFYTAIVSSGYFAQKGDWIWVAIFGVIIALGIAAICAFIGAMSG